MYHVLIGVLTSGSSTTRTTPSLATSWQLCARVGCGGGVCHLRTCGARFLLFGSSVLLGL